MERLEEICEEAAFTQQTTRSANLPKVMSEAKSSVNPWTSGSPVGTALETFASRIDSQDERTKLEDLQKAIAGRLGHVAVDILSGVYNPARIYRFLKMKQGDVIDAIPAIIENSNARASYKMDEKR